MPHIHREDKSSSPKSSPKPSPGRKRQGAKRDGGGRPERESDATSTSLVDAEEDDDSGSGSGSTKKQKHPGCPQRPASVSTEVMHPDASPSRVKRQPSLTSPQRRRLLEMHPEQRAFLLDGGGNRGQQQRASLDENTPFFRLPAAPPQELQAGLYIFLLTGICAVSGGLFGYDTGVVSGALLSIRRDLNLNEAQQELVVSITTVGAVVGSLAGGWANERAGRRPVILLSSLIFTLGAVVMGAAPDLVTLTIGRLVIGVAVGLSSMTIPIYIAEAAPASIRGSLVTINCIFITGGQFLAGMVDGAFARTQGGWRYMLGIAGVPAALQFVGILFLPESPRWLVAKGHAVEARGVLQKLRASGDVEFEMAEIEEDVAETASLPMARLSDLWSSPPIRRAVTLGCGLMLLQQLSGINTVMYYSASIYTMAGFSDEAAIWLAGFTALAQFVGMVANMLLVERWGRRTLVLSSLALVTASLLAIGASFYLAMASSEPVTALDPACAFVSNVFLGPLPVKTCFRCVDTPNCGYCPALHACLPGNSAGPTGEQVCPTGSASGPYGDWVFDACRNDYGYMSVAAMVAYLFTFGLGMGAMPWTICAEIFPLHVRSLANSLSTSVNWIGNVVISATFLSIASPHALTQYGAFWLYAAIATAGFVGLYFTLPETKGVPLEEIEALFMRPSDALLQNLVAAGGGGGGGGNGGGAEGEGEQGEQDREGRGRVQANAARRALEAGGQPTYSG
jgi:MFS transporter, SP family, solute carrier family 2 (myo-inositol transporter), member 13